MTCSDSPSSLRFITSYARASMHLHLSAWSDDGEGRLRDVEVVLCEDGRSVMIYAAHKDGAYPLGKFRIVGADHGSPRSTRLSTCLRCEAMKDTGAVLAACRPSAGTRGFTAQ